MMVFTAKMPEKKDEQHLLQYKFPGIFCMAQHLIIFIAVLENFKDRQICFHGFFSGKYILLNNNKQ